MSNSEMSYFFTEQVKHILFQIRCEIPSLDGGRIRRRLRRTQAMAGQTRICAETYFLYVAGKNPRRTPLNGKMAIYGWTLSIIIGSAMEICKLKNRNNAKTAKIDSNRHIDIRSIYFFLQP